MEHSFDEYYQMVCDELERLGDQTCITPDLNETYQDWLSGMTPEETAQCLYDTRHD